MGVKLKLRVVFMVALIFASALIAGVVAIVAKVQPKLFDVIDNPGPPHRHGLADIIDNPGPPHRHGLV